MSPERVQRLDQIGLVWEPRNEAWDLHLAALDKFQRREGHCRVLPKHQENNLKLGIWVTHQRQTRDSLSPDQVQLLNELGFSWDPRDEAWEANFAALEKFHAREGHSRVANKHQEEDLKLGFWVSNQRKRKDTLSPERIQRLNQLGFIWDAHG
jgi:hypothetical protein